MFYNSKTFDFACKQYDISPVETGLKIECNEGVFYTSNLLRTEDTIKSNIRNSELIKTETLNEIPLASFTDTKLKLPTILWMVVGRLQWYCNDLRQPEVREKSKKRINDFLDYLKLKGEDCVLIGHGFYFAQMVGELKKRGASGNMKKRIKNNEIRVFNF